MFLLDNTFQLFCLLLQILFLGLKYRWWLPTFLQLLRLCLIIIIPLILLSNSHALCHHLRRMLRLVRIIFRHFHFWFWCSKIHPFDTISVNFHFVVDEIGVGISVLNIFQFLRIRWCLNVHSFGVMLLYYTLL